MFSILGSCLRWLAHKGFVFVLILAVLVAVTLLRAEWINADTVQTAIATLQKAIDQSDGELKALKATAARLANTADAAIREVQKDLAGKSRYKGHIEATLQQKQVEREELMREHYVAVRIPGTEAWRKKLYLDALISELQQVVAAADEAIRRLKDDPRWKKAEDLLRRTAAIETDVVQKTNDLTAMHSRLANLRTDYEKLLLKQETFERVKSAVNGHLLMALQLLGLAIVVPVGIKLLNYYVIAPQATRFRPIRLLPETSGACRASRSATSLPITLTAGTELLIHPSYIQSTSVEGRKSTKWFLNWRLPFSSLLAGMVALTRIGASGGHPIVVSSTRDPLSEVCIVELPANAAMVCQPRALAGVVKDVRREVQITRHWRLLSLHGWLTFQLRYLVFHGPCQLILKGCRGVKVENADSGRLINQAATLGFSANVAYANRRCETFVSYWTGEDDLFNDTFAGKPGVFVYEETPSYGRKTGITGRGLEGLFDAVLKAFGI